MAPSNSLGSSLALTAFLSLFAGPVLGQHLQESFETTLYVLSPDGILSTTHADGGPFLQVAFTAEPMSSMTQVGEELLLGAVSGSVYRFDMQSGDLSLAYFLASDLRAMVVRDDELLAGGSNGLLHRVDAKTGQTFSISQPGFAIEDLALDGDQLFAGTPAGDVYVEEFQVAGGFQPFASTRGTLGALGQDEEALYVGDTGLVRVFDKQTVDFLYAYPINSDVASFARDASQHLIADSSGTIHRVVSEDGTVLSSIQAPTQIAALWLPQPLGRISPTISFQQTQLGVSEEFLLETSPEQAGNYHLLLGSFGGNTPGLIVQQHQLSLNSDIYLEASLTTCLNGALVGCFGILDSEGRGTVQFDLPIALPPELVGLELRHAFLVLDQADPGIVVGVSQASEMFFQ